LRTLALTFVALVPALALADDGVAVVCQRADDGGREAPLVCRDVAGQAFTAVPQGQRLEVTDFVFASWTGRLEASSGGAAVWSVTINGARAGEGGASFSFRTGLGVPTGASLVTPGNGGAALVSGRLVPTGS
jgi:hypothetical protein